MDEIRVDFSRAKVGDKAWSVQLGECEVIELQFDNKRYPIVLGNGESGEGTYTINGLEQEDDKFPSAFLCKPVIIPQPEDEVEKGEVKKRWVNVYRNTETIHTSPQAALGFSSPAALMTAYPIEIPLPGKVRKRRWKVMEGVTWMNEPDTPYHFVETRSNPDAHSKRAILLVAEDVEDAKH